ncbi:MAG: hypothetical protein H6737_11515 [Alphaproteobacteria bacterium]|nr:hypothetical protein [Alphaproteobacteria bacterium]
MAREAPAGLKVRYEMDGFRCELPGLKRGSNSAWILPFVAVWWLAAAAASAVLMEVFPALGDEAWLPVASFLGLVGLMGWAPGWYVADAWYAWSNPRTLEVDAVGLAFEGRRWGFAEADRFSIGGGYLSIGAGRDHALVRLGTTADEEAWLAERIGEMYRAVRDRAGEVPDALEELVDDAT